MSDEQRTETGIDIGNYTSERDAGRVAISKPVKASGNYIYMRSTYAIKTVDGAPQLVESTPDLRNINRATVADFREKLALRAAEIDALIAQLDAIEVDMDALDAA